MNKNAIQKFAIWARNELIAQVSQRAYQYGIEESGFGDASADTIGGRLLTAEEKSQRQELIKQIREKGYKQVMEEVSYTWFNRFIALRFMEVNNYLPTHIRVFSDSTGAFKPEILNDVLHLDLPGLDSGKVAECIESNDTDHLYRYLLLTQCNALNSSLPIMFERMGGYTEMLLPNNILKADSVIGRMVSEIPEEDWTDQVQIIGWLYQYYNTELKDDTFAKLKKNVKITKERIPAATQLFTPDWIVRYMVENSLGRLWLEGHPNAGLRGGWKYYLDEAEQTEEVEKELEKLRESSRNIKPEEIKLIDPCMGSGHILVYAFDVLMEIYKSAGWDEREAAQSILKNNLYGLDIDDRAAQLAYFAVMMKARQYDRRLLSRGIQPNIYAIRESNNIEEATVKYFCNGDETLKADIGSILTEMTDAKEYGSILSVTKVNFERIYARFDEISDDIAMVDKRLALEDLLPVVRSAELLSRRYDVVVTNPPYMGGSGMNNKLSELVKKKYPDSKSDLFAVFIERCGELAKENGYQAMITQHAWMFLSSFEKLRAKLLSVDIVNMAHLGARAFEEIGGEVVQTTTFVIQRVQIIDYKGEYCRLIEPTTQDGKRDMFLSGENRYSADQSNFSKIPGSPVAYWVGENFYKIFETENIGNHFDVKAGICTGKNESFIFQWHELDFCESSMVTRNYRYTPHNKGGEYRKWYGNREFFLKYNRSALKQMEVNAGFRHDGKEYYFKPHIGWSKITSSSSSFRFFEQGFTFDSAGLGLFSDNANIKSALGVLNSKVVEHLISILNPTLNVTPMIVKKLPYPDTDVAAIVDNCIAHSKDDWDSYETSWDFKRNPLV